MYGTDPCRLDCGLTIDYGAETERKHGPTDSRKIAVFRTKTHETVPIQETG